MPLDINGRQSCLAQHWFWNKNDQPRPITELHQLYRDVTSGGDNLLLDFAPDKTGRIPDDSEKALMELKKAIDDPSRLGNESLAEQITNLFMVFSYRAD